MSLWLCTGLWAQPGNLRFYDHSQGLESNWVSTVKTSSSGEVWMVSNDHLIRYGGYAKQVVDLRDETGQPLLISSIAWAEDHIWIGTPEKLLRYDLRTNTQHSFEISKVGALHLDHSGILWAESAQGLVKIDQKSQITFLQDSTDWGKWNVFDLQNDDQGNLWIATEDAGLLKLDIASATFKTVSGLFDARGKPQQKMRDLLLDRDGSIWAGSSGGGLFHLQSGQIQQFLPADTAHAITSTEAYTLAQDPSGNIWIGTWAVGLMELDRHTGKFSVYKANPRQSTSLPSNVIIDLQFHEEKLWLGTAYSGLWQTNLSDRNFTWWTSENAPVPLAHDNIWAIHEDTKQNLWLGTYQGGFYKIESDKSLKHYRPFVDFPANTVWGIFENSMGIWM